MENNCPNPVQESSQTQPVPSSPPTPPVEPQAPYQPPYSQPAYPQQPYAPQPSRESLLKKVYGNADTLLGKIMMWVSVALLVLTPLAVIGGVLSGVLSLVEYARMNYTFDYGFQTLARVFFTALFDGVQWAAVYAFMGTLLAFAKTRLDK